MKLSHKVTLLVLLPSACELVFVWILFQNLQELETKYKQQSAGKAVFGAVNHQLLYTLKGISAATLFNINREKYLKDMIAADLLIIEADRRHIESHPLMMTDEVQAFNTNMARLTDLLRAGVHYLDSDDMIGAARHMMKAQRLFQTVAKSMDMVLVSQKKWDEEQESIEVKLRQHIGYIVLGGVVFNLVLSAVLLIYFNKEISQKFQVLVRNTNALAAQQPLESELKGRDEIARIDHSFHELAAALAKSQKKERALTENAADLICSINSDLHFLTANPAAMKLLGYEPSELRGRPIGAVFDEKNLNTATKSFDEARQQGQITSQLLVLKNASTPLETLWSIQWSEDEGSYFCVVHDISERIRIEQLRKDITAMVTHDLRSPITTIKGMLDLFELGEYGEINERGKTSVARSQRNVHRLTRLITDLLDIEKIESGMFKLNRGEHSSTAIIRQAVDSVQSIAEAKQVKLDIQGDDFSVFCDDARIVRVIVNLLDNALKFAPKGSSVSIVSSILDDAFKVAVQDRGKGIAAESLQKIFDRFAQVDSEISERTGTGLGLAICKAIIEAHSGKIAVTSEPGQGALFWFEIPKFSAS